jgi:3-hydroxyisobutyrate dehydrogenase
MSEIIIRKEGRAGRITLNRPKALNALSYEMCLETEKALDAWRHDDEVDLIVLDAEGDRAFCAGGDIADLYRSAQEQDYDYGRRFWSDEYRMNAKIAEYPKPVVAFLNGFVMGGGVGIGGHCAHRIVGESTQISMPECSIGFVPDVGGSYLLSKAPGRLGEYLGLTAARMGAGDAVHAGFADHFVPEAEWEALKARLVETGDITSLPVHAAPESPLKQTQDEIDALFSGEALIDVVNALRNSDSDFAVKSLKTIGRNAPLSMAVTIEMLHRLRMGQSDIRKALELEYRVCYRIMEHGDMIEGIRAAIIDKDRSPKWRHDLENVPAADISKMLLPLGKNALSFRERAMKIGFIGLGNMGGPMAANLAKEGHAVAGFDVAGTTAEGVASVNSAAEAAKDADVVITMLPNGEILRAVASDVIPAMSKGAVLLDCSTVDVASARAVAELCGAAELGFLDAPVSGGIGGAAGGTLTFMVGGTQTALD